MTLFLYTTESLRFTCLIHFDGQKGSKERRIPRDFKGFAGVEWPWFLLSDRDLNTIMLRLVLIFEKREYRFTGFWIVQLILRRMYPVPGSKMVGPRNWKSANTKIKREKSGDRRPPPVPSSQITRSYFHAPFTFTSSPLSESLEQMEQVK